MQNWFCLDAAVERLESKGKVLEVDLDGKSLRGGTEEKAPERVEAVKGVDRTEMREEEKR